METLTEITSNDVGLIDRELYAEFVAEVEIELAPSGILERCHAAHIVRALWRLRQLATIDETEHRSETRESIDREIRSKNRILKLHKQMLRELQTDKQIRNHFGLPITGVVSTRDYLRAEKQLNRSARNPQPAPPPPPAEPESPITALTAQIEAVESSLNHLLKDFTTPNFDFLKKRTQFHPAAAPDPSPETADPPQTYPKAV